MLPQEQVPRNALFQITLPSVTFPPGDACLYLSYGLGELLLTFAADRNFALRTRSRQSPLIS